MDCYDRFAKNLTTLREADGIGKQDLSHTLGMAKGRIGSFELRQNEPRLHEAVAICEYFNVSLDQMVYREFE